MKLSPGERFLIQRRRQGLSQWAAARLHRVGPERVRQWEHDLGTVPPPQVELVPDRLSPGERCFLFRRRSGLTAVEVALELRTSRKVIFQREQDKGDVIALLTYWRQRDVA